MTKRNCLDNDSTDYRLVLPDIPSKSRSGDSDSTQVKAESGKDSEKLVEEMEHKRSSSYIVSDIKQFYQSSNRSSVIKNSINNDYTPADSGNKSDKQLLLKAKTEVDPNAL